jgi:hypothetical protein
LQGSDTIPAGDSLNFTTIVPSDTIFTGNGDSVALVSDPLRVQADSLLVVEPDFSHSPSKAIMYALVLPGLGQAYNRKYYKMPIVWAALGGAGYAISYNSRNYKLASVEYAQVPDNTNERYLRFWRRNLELSYIALLAVYALQVVDAYVDAQLYNWEVSENLAIGISPSLQPLMHPHSTTGQSFGLSCSLNLKRMR